MLVALLAGPLLLASTPDHLLPDTGMGLDGYGVALERWLTPYLYGQVTMVCTPSFANEVAVFILKPEKFAKEKRGPFLVVREPRTPIWDAYRGVLTNVSRDAKGEVDWEAVAASELAAAAATKVDVVETRAPIDAETIDLLEKLWASALLDVRPPDLSRSSVGLDGETCRFSDFVYGIGNLEGQTWSPDDGTRMRDLVNVGRAMIAYVRATPELRPPELAKLRLLATEAQKKFTPTSVPRER